jgi:hypothetical protein
MGVRPPTSFSWQLAWGTLVLSCTLQLFWLLAQHSTLNTQYYAEDVKV